MRACSLLPAVTGNLGKPGAGFLYLNLLVLMSVVLIPFATAVMAAFYINMELRASGILALLVVVAVIV